jgi:hypothetical protein
MSRQSLVPRFHVARRITAVTLTLLLLVQTTGCVSWDPQTRPQPALQKAKPKTTYRITLAGEMVYQLTNVRLQGDSLFGVASPPPTTGPRKVAPIQVAVPWSQVKRVERRSDQTATVLLLTAAVIGALGAIAMQDFMSGPLLGDNWRW